MISMEQHGCYDCRSAAKHILVLEQKLAAERNEIATLKSERGQLIDDKSNLLREVNRLGAEIADERKMRVGLTKAVDAGIMERASQLIAHRGCTGMEHDPQNGKIHGYCIVCGVEWPCDIAKPSTALQKAEVQP